MEIPLIKDHWEKIYSTRKPEERSWTQEVPQLSLELIQQAAPPKEARIVDIGGGDSHLVDHLLALGFRDITVLDISAFSLEQGRKRLGHGGEGVTWVASDVLSFVPERAFDVWHDRATFHFLDQDEGVARYAALAAASIMPGGHLIVGTFSENGPEKCSGLKVRRYSEQALTDVFAKDFVKVKCVRRDHKTPSNALQNFIFCIFQRKA